jgi:CHASE3 domain sensor protein
VQSALLSDSGFNSFLDPYNNMQPITDEELEQAEAILKTLNEPQRSKVKESLDRAITSRICILSKQITKIVNNEIQS